MKVINYVRPMLYTWWLWCRCGASRARAASNGWRRGLGAENLSLYWCRHQVRDKHRPQLWTLGRQAAVGGVGGVVVGVWVGAWVKKNCVCVCVFVCECACVCLHACVHKHVLCETTQVCVVYAYVCVCVCPHICVCVVFCVYCFFFRGDTGVQTIYLCSQSHVAACVSGRVEGCACVHIFSVCMCAWACAHYAERLVALLCSDSLRVLWKPVL